LFPSFASLEGRGSLLVVGCGCLWGCVLCWGGGVGVVLGGGVGILPPPIFFSPLPLRCGWPFFSSTQAVPLFLFDPSTFPSSLFMLFFLLLFRLPFVTRFSSRPPHQPLPPPGFLFFSPFVAPDPSSKTRRRPLFLPFPLLAFPSPLRVEKSLTFLVLTSTTHLPLLFFPFQI